MVYKTREAYQKKYAAEHAAEKRAYYDAHIDKLRAYGIAYGKRKRAEAREKKLLEKEL